MHALRKNKPLPDVSQTRSSRICRRNLRPPGCNPVDQSGPRRSLHFISGTGSHLRRTSASSGPQLAKGRIPSLITAAEHAVGWQLRTLSSDESFPNAPDHPPYTILTLPLTSPLRIGLSKRQTTAGRSLLHAPLSAEISASSAVTRIISDSEKD